MILHHIIPYLRYHLLLSSLYQKWDDIIPLNIYYHITYYTIITCMPLVDGKSQLSFAAQLPRPWSSTASSKNTPSWPPTASKQSGPPGRGVVDVTGGSLKGRFKDENMANLAKHLGISWDVHRKTWEFQWILWVLDPFLDGNIFSEWLWLMIYRFNSKVEDVFCSRSNGFKRTKKWGLRRMREWERDMYTIPWPVVECIETFINCGFKSGLDFGVCLTWSDGWRIEGWTGLHFGCLEYSCHG